MTDSRPDGSASRDSDDVFKKIERRVLELIRGIAPGKCSDAARSAVVGLCTVHLLRSRDFRDAQLQLLNTLEPDAIDYYGQLPEVHRRYVAQYGKPPPPGVIEEIVSHWVSGQRDGAVFFDSTEERLETVDGLLRRWPLQIVAVDPSLPGLALGDNPVVHADLHTGRFGFRDGLAVGDATLIMAPLSRRIAVFFHRERTPPVYIRTHVALDRVNALTVRAARAEVACHPEDARRVRRVCADVRRHLPDGPQLLLRTRQ